MQHNRNHSNTDSWPERAIDLLVTFYKGEWKVQYPIFLVTLILTITYALFMDLGLKRPPQSISYECVVIVFFLLLGLPILTHMIAKAKDDPIKPEKYSVYVNSTGRKFLEEDTIQNFIVRECNSLEDFVKDYSLVRIKEFISR